MQGGGRQRSYHRHDTTRAGQRKSSLPKIANAALKGTCVPDSWKREVMFPVEKIEGTIQIEKHRPIMLIEAYRKARTGILIKRVRRV